MNRLVLLICAALCALLVAGASAAARSGNVVSVDPAVAAQGDIVTLSFSGPSAGLSGFVYVVGPGEFAYLEVFAATGGTTRQITFDTGPTWGLWPVGRYRVTVSVYTDPTEPPGSQTRVGSDLFRVTAP